MKAIIFDFDGTLVDSMPIWRGLGKKYLKSIGVVPKRGLREQLSRLTMSESVELLIEEYQLEKTSQEVNQELNDLLRDRIASLKLRPFFQEILEYFKNRGIRMCIATANEREHIEAFIKSNQLEDYFEFILTCSETNTNKGNSEIYDLACTKFNLDKIDVVVVEDALHAIKSCQFNGYYVIGMYDANEINNVDQIKYLSDKYYYSPEAWYRELLKS